MDMWIEKQYKRRKMGRKWKMMIKTRCVTVKRPNTSVSVSWFLLLCVAFACGFDGDSSYVMIWMVTGSNHIWNLGKTINRSMYFVYIYFFFFPFAAAFFTFVHITPLILAFLNVLRVVSGTLHVSFFLDRTSNNSQLDQPVSTPLQNIYNINIGYNFF